MSRPTSPSSRGPAASGSLVAAGPIRSRVQVRAVDSDGHVLAMARVMFLVYDPREYSPYAVCLLDPGAGELVFARELLAAVLDDGGAGEGKVRLRLAFQQSAWLLLERVGACPLGLRPQSAASFLARTYEIVPAGSEDVHADLDDALDQLLPPAA